jgi:hypothetical protein
VKTTKKELKVLIKGMVEEAMYSPKTRRQKLQERAEPKVAKVTPVETDGPWKLDPSLDTPVADQLWNNMNGRELDASFREGQNILHNLKSKLETLYVEGEGFSARYKNAVMKWILDPEVDRFFSTTSRRTWGQGLKGAAKKKFQARLEMYDKERKAAERADEVSNAKYFIGKISDDDIKTAAVELFTRVKRTLDSSKLREIGKPENYKNIEVKGKENINSYSGTSSWTFGITGEVKLDDVTYHLSQDGSDTATDVYLKGVYSQGEISRL